MALPSLWSSLQRVVRSSNNHVFAKVHPSASLIYTTGKSQVHTKHVTETILPDDKHEQPNHIATAVPHDELMSRLLKCSSLREQLLTLPTELRLSPLDIKQRHAICDMVSEMIKPFFHDFTVQMFGSSVNGLGFKGCDIDMAFETSVERKNMLSISRDDSEVPTIVDVLNGRVSPMHMSRLSSSDKLLFIHTVFLDYYKESTVAPLYIGAYIPIIRFHHDFHKLKVDLSCGNKYAFANTKLLSFYGQLDSRVIPLMMAIRYWAKHGDLIGGGLMFNSYCLTLLTVYFLQNRNPPVLPTVEQIISKTGSIDSVYMFDDAFFNATRNFPSSSNTESIEQLLREFFFYYFYFDFDDVICPLNGKAMSRREFLGSEYSKKFRFNTICVQDPFKLTHNVSNLVDFKHCKTFAREMLRVCRMFQGDGCSSQSGIWGLAALFQTPRGDAPIPSNVVQELKVPLGWAVEEGQHTSETNLLLKAVQAVSDTFQKVLLFRCDLMQEFTPQSAADGLREADTRLLVVKKFAGNSNTWLGRSNEQSADVSLENPLDLERDISLKLCERKAAIEREERRRAETKKCEFEFLCKFYATKENGELHLVLKLVPKEGSHFNPILEVFLKDYVPRIMKKLL